MNTLHFPGDHTNFDADHIIGPDLFGGSHVAVSAEYDGQRTTMSYRPVPPKELAERKAAEWDRMQRYYRIEYFFKGHR